MKKTIAVLGLAIVAVCYTYVQHDRSTSSVDTLLLQNVEVLAGSEAEVYIPCAVQKRSSCTFKSEDADGEGYANSWKDYVKV